MPVPAIELFFIREKRPGPENASMILQASSNKMAPVKGTEGKKDEEDQKTLSHTCSTCYDARFIRVRRNQDSD
jgi:hypothetical protein